LGSSCLIQHGQTKTTAENISRFTWLQLQKDDVVLELGCSYGVCTHILSQHAQEVRGVDNSHQLIAEVSSYP
jgi:protein-L-isoaspartate O-methyltransferase